MKTNKEISRKLYGTITGLWILLGFPFIGWLYGGWKLAITVLIISQFILMVLKNIIKNRQI